MITIFLGFSFPEIGSNLLILSACLDFVTFFLGGLTLKTLQSIKSLGGKK